MTGFKYQTLQKELEQGIQTGIFTSKLPSVRALAKEHQVSVSTIQKAYDRLERVGLIYAEPKRGYFVTGNRQNTASGYGHKYQKVSCQKALELQVLYSINDDNLVPLASTAPSSVVNNQALLTKLHKKVFDKSIYQFHVEDEVQGSSQLRQNISQFLYRQGQTIAPKDIYITSGRREGLFIALLACQAIGGTVAAESPNSFYYQSLVSRVCKEIIEVPMQANYSDELALLDQAHKEYGFTTYLVNPSFNDPTGRVLSESQKLALLKWARNARVTLIEYDRSELYLGTDKPKSLAQLASQVTGVKVISIQDFFDTVSSRIYLGFVLSVNMEQKLLDAKHTVTEEPSLHVQNIVNELISSGQYELALNKLRAKLNDNYAKALKIFNTHLPEQVQFSQVKGGPCLWLKLQQPSSIEVWQSLIDMGVAIAPGSMFGLNANFENYFRVTFALPWSSELALALTKVCQATAQAQ